MSDAGFWRGEDEATNHAVRALSPDLDLLFGLLSHPRRRALLYLLQDARRDPAWTANLAVRLAAIEADEDEDEDFHDVAEEIDVTLRHNHLPKLADAALIDVDSTVTTLTYEGDDRLENLLRWAHPVEGDGVWLGQE